MQNPPRGIQKGAVEARAGILTRDVLCYKTLQEMGCIMAAERDEAASGQLGESGVRGDGRVWRGDGSITTGSA